MSLISRSIPGLFGGVSQQVPALRHPTQGDIQENAVATLVEGLSKREGFQHIRNVALTGPNGASIRGSNGTVFSHVVDRGAEGRFSLLIINGNLMVHDLATGAVKTVAFPTGKAYLNCANPETDFHAVSVADYTFILNRTTTVATTSSVSGSRPVNRGLVYVKQAVASVNYNVTVDGTTVNYTSTATPQVVLIVDGLVAALNAALPSGYGFSVVTPPGASTGPVISIVKTSGAAVSVSASDGYGNLLCIPVHDNVASYSDLPANLGSTANFVCKVSPNPSSSKGAYWVLWDPVKHEYQECSSPGLPDTLDPATLPHKLVYEADGTFTFSTITDWTKRKAGDNESNPVPSFVGQKLNDVFFFRNRLGLLSQDSVALSKASKYFSYFGDSAQAILDTDPVDLSNPTEQVVSLEWAVPFNEQLLIWSDKRQFVLVSGDILSPKTARLVPSTAFETYTGVRPEPLGNKCIFATTAGDFTAIRMLRVAADTVTNQADDVTEHVPRYIPKNITRMRASTAAKMVVVLDGSSGMFFFNFEMEKINNNYTQSQFTQRAWSRLVWDDVAGQATKIIQAHWVDRRLYVVRFIKDTGDTLEPGGRFMFEQLDFQNLRKDAGVDFSLRLDRKTQAVPISFDGTNTTIAVPYWERQVLTVLRCSTASMAPASVEVLSTTYNTDGTMNLVVAGNTMSAYNWVGRRFTTKYRFTEMVMKDQNDAPMQNVKLSVKSLSLNYVNTGFFKILVTPYLRETYTYSFSGNVLGTVALEGNQLATGNFKIPVDTTPRGTTVEIQSDSFYPAVFPYAEWTIKVNLKAQR